MDSKPQTLKGFRDFMPEAKRKRDYVVRKLTSVFELFGFEPLETPTLESAGLLLGKYGSEADKLVYTFEDQGKRKVGLRYDQTVPTARILYQYQATLPKFFRRYQIQNVFRAEKPQKGRFREFTQCDIDIFGSTSALADAEIIAATYFSFKAVGYPQIKISINDRQTLFKYLEPFKTSAVSVMSLIQTVDKLEKIGTDKVVEELVKKGLNDKNAKAALSSISSATPSGNLNEIIEYSKSLGVPPEVLLFQPTLARGLDYYTGMIFEVSVPGYEAGSCGGGGRYDKLIDQLGGVDVPAVGIAFGFDRMVEAADFFKLIPEGNGGIKTLVTIFSPDLLQESLKVARTLRDNDIKTEVCPQVERLDKQLKYADKIKADYVVIIGPDELQKGVLKLKDMKTGEQKQLTLELLVKELK